MQIAGRARSGGAAGFPPDTPPPQARAPPLRRPSRPRRTIPLRREPGAAPGAPQQTPPTMGSQSSKAPRGDVTAEEAAGASPAKANGQVGALGTACPGPLLSHLAPSRALGRGRALCPARDTRRPLPRPVPLFSAPQPPRVKREEGRGGGAGRAPPPSLFAAPAPGAAPRPSRVQRREQRAAPRGRPGAAGWVPSPPGTPSTAPTSVDHGLFSRGESRFGEPAVGGGQFTQSSRPGK